MKLGTYLRESKEKYVLIEDKNKMLIANEIVEIIQEIDDFPYSVIDCEVFINVSKR